MENFYKKIVAHPGAILFLFVSFAILGAAGGFFIEVNYDMNDYLPPDSPSTLAVNKMYDKYKEKRRQIGRASCRERV